VETEQTMNQGIADALVFFGASGSLAGKEISPACKHFPDGQSKNPTRQID
jgi:glucose-6-phosphate 1-dehydrogenase